MWSFFESRRKKTLVSSCSCDYSTPIRVPKSHRGPKYLRSRVAKEYRAIRTTKYYPHGSTYRGVFPNTLTHPNVSDYSISRVEDFPPTPLSPLV